jgi:hypothetical protein
MRVLGVVVVVASIPKISVRACFASTSSKKISRLQQAAKIRVLSV